MPRAADWQGRKQLLRSCAELVRAVAVSLYIATGRIRLLQPAPLLGPWAIAQALGCTRRHSMESHWAVTRRRTAPSHQGSVPVRINTIGQAISLYTRFVSNRGGQMISS